MNKNVKAAIRLLSKAPYRVRIGTHNNSDCPIATGYRVNAVSSWQNCLVEDMTILRSYGWNGLIYNSFLRWYDAYDDMEEREIQLRKLLIIVKKKVRKEVRWRHRQHRRIVIVQ